MTRRTEQMGTAVDRRLSHGGVAVAVGLRRLLQARVSGWVMQPLTAGRKFDLVTRF